MAGFVEVGIDHFVVEGIVDFVADLVLAVVPVVGDGNFVVVALGWVVVAVVVAVDH